MSAEVLEQIELVEADIKACTLEKIRIEQRLQILRDKKSDLKNLYNKKLSDEQAAWETWTERSYPWQRQAQHVLETIFGLKEFRKQQLAVINATLSKKDTILIMPTGAGKSLCYQLPTLLEKGMTLVISPLIALMEDQIHKLQDLNVPVEKLTSSESANAKKAILQYLSKGTGRALKLLYVSPEMLVKSKRLMSGLQALHKAGNFNRIAVDEVHCCSEWGHDFRPDYRYVGLLKDLFKDVPILGLTATATAFILNDVRDILNIPACTIVKAPFDRPNLFYKVISKPSKTLSSVQLVNEIIMLDFKDCSGIIYVNSIKECEDVTKALKDLGWKVHMYHAQLSVDSRSKIHTKWMQNVYQIIVATVAFGLGIDKPDVRFVIHFSVPKTIEDLYQQGGRAGRDGKPATYIILYRLTDYLKHSGLAKSRKEMQRTAGVLNYVLNSKDCRHGLIAEHFEDDANIKCKKMCDNCLRDRGSLEWFSLKRPCQEIYQAIDTSIKKDIDLTLAKLIDAWYKTYNINVSKEDAENIVAHLINKGFIREHKVYTSYTVLCYLRKAYDIVPETEMAVYMSQNAALRRYLGPAPKPPVMKQETRKRKTIDDFCQPSTSKVKVEKLN